MINKSISYNDSKIHYNIQGEGKPIMLIHGFGEDGKIWENQIEFLRKDYLIIVPDLPGSGKSEILLGENILIDDYAEVIKAILKEEQISKCAMLGHSMGGYIILSFVEKYPQLSNSFGLIHSTAYADSEAKKETRQKAIDFIIQNGSKAFLKTSIPGLFFDNKKSNIDIEKLIQNGSNFKPNSLVQYYKAMIVRPDKTSVLTSFAKPVLFIIGQHDQAIPLTDILQQTYLPSHAYIYILRKSAHMGLLEEKERVNEILAQFLHSI